MYTAPRPPEEEHLVAPLATFLTAALLPAAPAAGAVCASSQDRIVINHRTGDAQLLVHGTLGDLADGDDPRVPTGDLTAEVTHTNTALFSFSVAAEKVPAEELVALRGFVAALGPYFVEAAKRIVGPKGPETVAPAVMPPDLVAEVERTSKVLSEDLAKLDQKVFGTGGIRWADILLATALHKLAAPVAEGPGESDCKVLPAPVADLEIAFGSHVTVRRATADTNACGHVYAALEQADLNVIADLETLYPDIVRHRDEAQKAIQDLRDWIAQLGTEPPVAIKALLEQADKVVASARQALADSGTVLGEARRVENTARAVLGSRTAWCSEPFAVSRSNGRKVTVTITARQGAPIASRQGPLTFTASLRPDWLVRPALGVSFLSSPDATYPTYAAVESEDGFRVAESGRQDSRFTYGLTLGLTWRGLDRRDDKGVAVWLPELIVNPSSDTRAVGVGFAVSFLRFVKVGGGYLWTRHAALDGQDLDQVLPAKDALRRREAYGDPRWYWSFSLVGWAPFQKD